MKTFKTAIAGVLVLVLISFLVNPGALAAVAGTSSRWIGNKLTFDGVSGANAWEFEVNGLHGDFGTGADDFCTSNGTNVICGTGGNGYIASGIPVTLDAVYVNNLIDPTDLNYGGRDLPAHPFTYTSIAFRVRTAGLVGTTDNTFVITGSGASVGVCNCTFACNSAQGNYRATCAAGSGVGCVFAASTDITYSISDGDCTTETDIQGNVSVEGIWQ